MKYFRGVMRFIALQFVMTYYITLALFRGILYPNQPEVIMRTLSQFMKGIAKTLNIKLEVSGPIPQEGVLLMPNHRSYTDVVYLPQYTPCTYVAKAEVRKWPIIGLGTKVAMTFYVDRSSKESRRQTRENLKQRLAKGYSVVVFPEGTTSKAPNLMRINPGMFFTAAASGVPIVPVAIEYEEPSDAWIDDDTFVPHFIKCFSKKETRVKMRFGEILRGDDGEALIQEVETWYRKNLADLQKEFGHQELITESA